MLLLVITSEGLLTLILETLFLIVWVGTIFVVITGNRNPVKTLAWVMVLVFLPVVGFVFYLFFGMDMRKEKIIGRRSLSKLLKEPLQCYKRHAVTELSPPYDKLIRIMKQVNQAYLLPGNNVEIFTEFPQMLCDMLRCISEAKHHIHMQFYMFMNDAVGYLLAISLSTRLVKVSRFVYCTMMWAHGRSRKSFWVPCSVQALRCILLVK